MNRILYSLGGGCIVFFIIFWRFLRPRAIGPIDLTYSNTKMLLYIFLITFFSMLLLMLLILPFYYKYLKSIQKDPKILIKNKDTLFVKVQQYFYGKVDKGRETYVQMIDEFFIKYIYENKIISVKIFERLVEIGNKIRHENIFIYVFYFLPPCLISLTYLIEVLVYKCFTYFPYIIFLMIFPLGIRVLLYTMEHHCRQMMKELNKYITLLFEDENKKVYKFCDNVPLSSDDQTDENLNILILTQETFLNYLRTFISYRNIIFFDPFKTFFQLFSVLCWIISFSTLLYLMLNN